MLVGQAGHGHCPAHTPADITVTSSGASPGEVPNDCFPETDIPAVTTASRRVTFAPIIQTTMEDTDPQVTDMDSPLADGCAVSMDAESGPTKLRKISEMTISPPPGFPQFQWPQADMVEGSLTRPRIENL